MAKSNKNEDGSTPPASPEDTALVVRAVMDITGCGEPAAQERVAGMKPATLSKIAKLEREDKRVDIVALLY